MNANQKWIVRAYSLRPLLYEVVLLASDGDRVLDRSICTYTNKREAQKLANARNESRKANVGMKGTV